MVAAKCSQGPDGESGLLVFGPQQSKSLIRVTLLCLRIFESDSDYLCMVHFMY